MTTPRAAARPRRPEPAPRLPAMLRDTTFEAVILDWDGTAVPDRRADASRVRAGIESLCAAGVHVVIVSGTHVGNVDGQLGARPAGPGRLHLCLNRGSEVFAVSGDGPALAWRREATAEEDRALDRAAGLAVQRLQQGGIDARVVSQRLNRRKIDLIPEPQWAEPPKARIGDLLAAVTRLLAGAGLADLTEVVAITADAARAAGLAHPRITSDVKHVEIGLTDKSDSARWAAAWLAERGLTGGLVLVVGDEFGPLGGVAGSDSLMLVPELARAAAVSVGVEPGGCPERVLHAGGGPARFLEIVRAQLARRRDHRVPSIDLDPAWVLPLPSAPHRQRAAEALGALANGWAGSRATREDDGPASMPLLAVNGMYTAGPAPELLAGPRWDALVVAPAGGDSDAPPYHPPADDPPVNDPPSDDPPADDPPSDDPPSDDPPSDDPLADDPPGNDDPPVNDERVVDLRTGVLARCDRQGFRTVRFVSAARPAVLALRAEAPPERLRPGGGLGAPDGGDASFDRRRRRGADLARVQCPPDGGITVAARDRDQLAGPCRIVERLAAWTAGRSRAPAWSEALGALEELEVVGFDGLLAEHRQAWARRWADAEVCIEGASADELAARFAVFHLLGAAPGEGEAAVGARGLTGRAYGGHVFWDADVFVLPALAAIHPDGARAMLEYRIRRLPAARAEAARRGRRGARFPWESAADGSDVTPTHAPGRHGALVPVHTGEHQEHIVADVAWSACRYVAWTGDTGLLTGPGRPLLVETARYWASRIRRDAEGRAHIEGVMGPDEYHAVVDDNAYTNVLARWNLRRAADLVEAHGGDGRGEAAEWRALADALADGYDPERGLYEQFAGYWRLEPLLAAQVAPPPVAADLLLGAERVTGSQLIKQADVAMLHHLLPDEVVPGTLAADLAFYEPRTAHGSSLSPAIYAAQLARARRPNDALALFRLAARLDLDDMTGTTTGGLHFATFGGVWQALADGFLGLRPAGETLTVDPCLPSAWDALALRFRFLGHPVGVRAEVDRVDIRCRAPLAVRIAAGPVLRCEPPGTSIQLEVIR